MNRTLMGKVRSMLIEAKLSPKFWAEAVNHAVYLQQMLQTSAHGYTPLEIMEGFKPDVGHLRIFGYLVHATMRKEGQRKLSPRVKSMIHMGHHSSRV